MPSATPVGPHRWTTAFALAALCWTAAAAHPLSMEGQFLRGRVVSALDTARGISGAQVTVRDSVRGAIVARAPTDSIGRFQLRLDGPAIYQVSVAIIGYQPRTLAAFNVSDDEEHDLRIPMTPVAAVLPGVTTVERTIRLTAYKVSMADFERRRTFGHGRFMTRDQIEAMGSANLSDILTSGIAGVRTANPIPGGPSPILLSSRAVGSNASGPSYIYGGRRQPSPQTFDDLFAAANTCPVVFYINGARANSGTDSPGLMWTKLQLVYSMTADDIEALEVYRGLSEYPAEFASSDASCGVIAIWTRRSLKVVDKEPRKPKPDTTATRDTLSATQIDR